MHSFHKFYTKIGRLAGLSGPLTVILLLVTSAVVYAQQTQPPYLQEDVIVGSNGALYQFWYTTTCAPNDPDCDCDAEPDDVNNDGIINEADYDLPNACVASRDTNGDLIFDEADDFNSNDLPDVVDPDWDGGGEGTEQAESIVPRLPEILDVFVGNWGVSLDGWTRDPLLNTRDIWVLDGQAAGYAYPDGSRMEMSASMLAFFAGTYNSRQTLAHEIWHMVQHSYDANIGTGKWSIEGQARMVPDRVWEAVDNSRESSFLSAARRFISSPIRPVPIDSDNDGDLDIAQAQGVLGITYDAALWWAYLVEQAGTEHFGTPGEGMDFLRAVLEKGLLNTPKVGWDAVDATLRERTGRGFDDTFWDFSIANYARNFDLTLLSAADLGGRNPQQVLRYRDEGTVEDDLDYGRVPTETVAMADMIAGSNGLVASVVPLVESYSAMPIYGAKYYEGVLPAPADCPVAYWRVDSAPQAQLMHTFLLLEDRNGNGVQEVTSMARHQGELFGRAVVNRAEYRAIAGIVSTGGQTDGYAWQMGCEDVGISIVEPTQNVQAAVGAPGNLGRFMVWVEAKGLTSGSPLVGLDAQSSFAVQVGGVNAQILHGDVVQNRYWLIVQAPEIPGAGPFDTFDVRVDLVGTSANDLSANAVIYGVQPREQVLLIDRSGSMIADDKLFAAQNAARLFVDTVREDDQLGIVSFNDAVTTNFVMTRIPDQDDAAGTRANARLTVDALTAAGDTAIGTALARGQSLLNINPVTTDNWMVLLSDGINTAGTAPLTVLNTQVLPADSKVHAIALGHSADHALLRRIAELSCGEALVDHCFHAADEVSGAPVQASAVQASALNMGLADTYLRIGESMANHQRLWQGEGSGKENVEFAIENTRGSNALLSIYWDCEQKPGAIQITPPNNVKLIERSDVGHTVYFMPELASGRYALALNGDCAWRGVLSSYITAGVEMHAFVDTTTAERRLYKPAQLQVSLSDERGPRADASVVATVYRFDGTQEQIALRDDGVGPHDREAGDGVYGYSYDRVNGVELHNITFDIVASTKEFTRYKRLTYRPANISRTDADADGLPDVWQARYDVSGADVDADGDLLTNRQEMDLGTDPTNADSDHGGEDDGSEVTNGRRPLDASDDELPVITDFWCESGQETAVLHFNPRPEFEQIRVLRVEDATGPVTLSDFKALGDFSATDGPIVDSGLKNDRNYLYMLQALAGSGKISGAYTIQQLCQPAQDPYPPTSQLVINGGASTTDSHVVTLHLLQSYAEGQPEITHVKLSNTPAVDSAKWEPFSPEMEWKIDPNPKSGWATVYALFLDEAGNVSDESAADSIRLESKGGGTFGDDEFTIYLPLLKR